MMRILLAAWLLLCGPGGALAQPVAATDDRGNAIELARPAAAIASRA